MIESITSVESSESTVMKSNKILICHQTGCFDMSTVSGFCRLHYLSNWKKLKTKEAKKYGKDLEVYMTELAARFPEEFFEKLKNDIEEMSTEAGEEEAEKTSPFDTNDGDEDVDTIIKGIKVEDF